MWEESLLLVVGSKQPESIRHPIRKAKGLELRKHGMSWDLSKMKVVMLFNNCWCWFLLFLLGLLHPPLLAALAGHQLGLGEKRPKKWAFLSGCTQTHLCLCLRAFRHLQILLEGGNPLWVTALVWGWIICVLPWGSSLSKQVTMSNVSPQFSSSPFMS